MAMNGQLPCLGCYITDQGTAVFYCRSRERCKLTIRRLVIDMWTVKFVNGREKKHVLVTVL